MTDGATPLPLADVRVVELGQLLAGPFCGQLLGDFGAEIIKVEDPGRGDPMRQWGREKPYGMSLWWPVVARNKKSVTANLRDHRGHHRLGAGHLRDPARVDEADGLDPPEPGGDQRLDVGPLGGAAEQDVLVLQPVPRADLDPFHVLRIHAGHLALSLACNQLDLFWTGS